MKNPILHIAQTTHIYHTLNEDMLNAKQTENNKKWLIFWSNFFNLLTHWRGDKLESLPSLLRVYKVYRVYQESTKTKSLLKSQLTEDKWTRKLVRISELTREFNNIKLSMRIIYHYYNIYKLLSSSDILLLDLII